jgi:hypothetical protein
MERSLEWVIQLLIFVAGKGLRDINMMWHFHLASKFVQAFSNVFQLIYEGMKHLLVLAGVEFKCDRKVGREGKGRRLECYRTIITTENFISISSLHTSYESMLANFVLVIVVLYFVFVVRIIEFIN